MSEANTSAVPTHVGLILDGNRRWAKAHGLPATEGHREGAETLKKVVRYGFNHGIRYISAYVFSTENWKRTKDEVKFLMSLMLRLLDRDIEQLHEDGIKVVVLGSRYGLSKRIVKAIDKAEAKTKDNQKGVLALCLNYGGHLELVEAVKHILQARVDLRDIDEETISKYLYHPEVPPCDMIIRTSGEQRLSNFMLWRSEYAELKFVDKNWPDFSDADFAAALDEYQNRHRRLGK
jgi:undecaprenyl diphosphate synthase